MDGGLSVNITNRNIAEGYNLDIMRNGIIMIVYLSIIFIMYMVLSTPFENIMTGLDTSANMSQVSSGVTNGKWVFNLIFAGLAIVPVIWFIGWSFWREPDWRQRL